MSYLADIRLSEEIEILNLAYFFSGQDVTKRVHGFRIWSFSLLYEEWKSPLRVGEASVVYQAEIS